MDIYVVIIEDRHADTDVELFTTCEEACDRAKAIATESARGNPVSEYLTSHMVVAGWLYHAEYSCEGDHVRVIKKVLK